MSRKAHSYRPMYIRATSTGISDFRRVIIVFECDFCNARYEQWSEPMPYGESMKMMKMYRDEIARSHAEQYRKYYSTRARLSWRANIPKNNE